MNNMYENTWTSFCGLVDWLDNKWTLYVYSFQIEQKYKIIDVHFVYSQSFCNLPFNLKCFFSCGDTLFS